MAVYATYSGSLAASVFLTVKPGAILPVKIIRVDLAAFQAAAIQVVEFTGGGAITGGSTATPFPLRDGTAAAGATSKTGATAVSGTQRTFDVHTVAIGSVATWTPPASLILAAGSSTVFAVSFGGSWSATIYFDELEVVPGF